MVVACIISEIVLYLVTGMKNNVISIRKRALQNISIVGEQSYVSNFIVIFFMLEIS